METPETPRNLINRDMSRCNNASCLLRHQCARFLQMAIDKLASEPRVSVNTLKPDGNGHCPFFIPTKDSDEY